MILVILGHPAPTSFNHAIAREVCTALQRLGHRVIFHDLCAEHFDPLLPGAEIPANGSVPDAILAYARELQKADGIVIVHPNWWGQPPAILKGWIDRVFRPGIAYRFAEDDAGEGVPIGLLKASAAAVFNTSNTPDAREHAVFGDPLENIWKRCIFDLCGVRNVHRRTFNVVVTSSAAERQVWLEEARALTAQIFPVDNQQRRS